MSRPLTASRRLRIRNQIQFLFDGKAEELKGSGLKPEEISHWARYLCVLTSGYLEQSVKEILQEYSDQRGWSEISRYFDRTWPRSQNMTTENICNALENFHTDWKDSFESWLNTNPDIKAGINNLISWRNYISHGGEINGVTFPSVRDKFTIAKNLIDKLEEIIP